MKKENDFVVAEKVAGYKEKLVNVQMQMAKIEKLCQYRDIEHFGFYKVLIEEALDSVGLSLLVLETNVENLKSLAESGVAFDSVSFDCAEWVCEEVKHGEKFIQPKMKEIEKMLKECVN